MQHVSPWNCDYARTARWRIDYGIAPNSTVHIILGVLFLSHPGQSQKQDRGDHPLQDFPRLPVRCAATNPWQAIFGERGLPSSHSRTRVYTRHVSVRRVPVLRLPNRPHICGSVSRRLLSSAAIMGPTLCSSISHLVASRLSDGVRTQAPAAPCVDMAHAGILVVGGERHARCYSFYTYHAIVSSKHFLCTFITGLNGNTAHRRRMSRFSRHGPQTKFHACPRCVTYIRVAMHTGCPISEPSALSLTFPRTEHRHTLEGRPCSSVPCYSLRARR